ncbi:glycosyltransferase family 2 protein [Robertkochia solimangrovi]|uniref:glycosyltransferase family 2 protein n=1 Tax=Robertkochia solimangrovi TaxID=2213046 RepID=UPI00117FC420|nr:glycosyltransferase family 2 protein [Robertkochia solimangrovi]TRZ45015.1 glycosyltransferase family 2 protein [Robertkochia solimangrovi]
MQNIAVLLTCFNRKDKTLKCLNSLYKALEESQNYSPEISIYLTDDGSSDGTGDAVRKNYPDVQVLEGTGSLFWAGGMRFAWKEAIKHNYDGYLLINDDTILEEFLFDRLYDTHCYSIQNFKKPGIYIGSTYNSETGVLTYGGWEIKNGFMGLSERIQPADAPQLCDLGNANIMMVPSEVVDSIGIISEGYRHGIADFDLTLKAKKKGFPNLLVPGFVGKCVFDHSSPYPKFKEMKFKERIKTLYSPIGLDFSSHLTFMRRHFPLRLPFVYFSGWLKVLFPGIYISISKLRG